MKRLSMIVAVIVLAIVLCGAGLYVVRNPERRTLDDAARAGAPGRFVRLSDGVTHYDVMGPDSGHAVLLVHGFSVPYYIWDSTAQALSSAGYRVLRYDEYGRGLSDRPNVEYTDDLFDRQISELLDSLKVTGRLDVGGVSMGGAVASMYTLRHPDRVRSLILVDPVAGTSAASQGMFDWPLVGPILWQALVVPKMADGQASDFADASRFPDWAERYREQMRYRGFGHALLSHRQHREGMTMDTVYQRVSRTAVPVLLVWGEQDKTVPFALSEGVRRAMPAAEFHAIAGAAHLPILEKAQLTDSLVLAFLGRQHP